MNKLYQIVFLCYIIFIAIIVIDSEANGDGNYRVKRYLRFGNISHFFYRLNTKSNMVYWNQIFAQAVGFRMNWDEPPDSIHPYHHLQRRTVYDNMETLMDRNGLNGFHCVRRAICEMQMIPNPRGVYHKILKMVFRQKTSATDRWHNVTEDDCQLSTSSCPFSLLHVSPYTDL